MIWMLRTAALALTLVAMMVPPALADSRQSVVRVKCLLANGGEMKATGFIWPKKGQMVTALHAVAGCQEIEVYSQKAKRSTVATQALTVDLEADLALLQLADDLGLEPVPHVDREPDLSRPFMTWGYPLVQKKVIGHKIEFGLGLDSNITTIGQAFEGDEIKELFKHQSYPGKATQILRVTSTIQPGHSGAPIFDERGHVVAIADGGLLGGFRGINWSIPAHIYLINLPYSQDPIPQEASDWAGLFSATQPGKAKPSSGEAVFGEDPVAPQHGGEGLDPAPAAEPEYLGDPQFFLGDGSGPYLLRQVTLREALDYMFFVQQDSFYATEIQNLMWDDALLEDVWFNVYQDPTTGGTLAFPSWVTIDWLPDGNYIWAYSNDYLYQMTAYFRQEETFENAMSHIYGHSQWIDGFAQWSENWPSQMTDPMIDYEWEHADYSRSHVGFEAEMNRQAFFMETSTVRGSAFLGASSRAPYPDAGPAQHEQFNALVMEAGMVYLTSLVDLQDWAWDYDRRYLERQGIGEGTVVGFGNDSDLTLVRQMSLRQALEYIRYLNEHDPFIGEIENMLWDESLKDEIWFNVYEDGLTGATVAVPSWMAMEWNNDTGMLFAYNDTDTLEMAVAVLPGDSFDGALEQLSHHVTDLHDWAEWYEASPRDFQWDYFTPDDQYAVYTGFYYGQDNATGRDGDMLMHLAVLNDVFLGTTVFMTPLGEEPAEEVVLEAMMMEISARYLSAFASF
ncbi:serine protease [Meridianimarinicoccus sp. MJW13]|uniref:S1 family peptidase n=1 Tax=Meridianimarinicoccus sp. MJW13 TaxID=2720031 RepID=UPI001867BA6F|nr:serine protease [Fluviibacterium sp. MJW13]